MSNGLNSLHQWLQDTIFKPLEDKKMPVMEHLVELQVRLTRVAIITAVVFAGTFFYADTLVKWLRIPLQNMFMPGTLSWVPTDLPTVPFVFLAPAEALWQNVKVAGLFAVVAATPYILFEIWQFVVPGLHAQERRFVAPFVMLTAVAFYAGVGLCIFLRASICAEFFDRLWRQRRFRSPDLHCAVCRICPLVLDGIRADFRSPAGDHTHGKTWMDRRAVPDPILEVGVTGLLCHRRNSDTDS